MELKRVTHEEVNDEALYLVCEVCAVAMIVNNFSKVEEVRKNHLQGREGHFTHGMPTVLGKNLLDFHPSLRELVESL